jgi:HSP20 family molecular chaperone IbpA
MRTPHFENYQNANKDYSIASHLGTPLNTRLKEIKHLTMKSRGNQIEIQINVEGLCGKNYKLEVIDDDLVLTALRLVSDSSPKDRSSSMGNYRWVTSTYVLPYPVDGSEINSELRGNILHIYLSRK